MIVDRLILSLEGFHEDGKVVNSLKDQSMIMSPQWGWSPGQTGWPHRPAVT